MTTEVASPTEVTEDTSSSPVPQEVLAPPIETEVPAPGRRASSVEPEYLCDQDLAAYTKVRPLSGHHARIILTDFPTSVCQL